MGDHQAEISIHAPAQGATQILRVLPSVECYFNPRTRTGCDLLPRGDEGPFSNFNPRTRTGCDHSGCPKPKQLRQFQSTHPHRVRLAFSCPSFTIDNFNPRTRTGCDPVLDQPLPTKAISIHAPAQGATIRAPRSLLGRGDFNPRTRTGCDLAGTRHRRGCMYFNPRTRTGCDIVIAQGARPASQFQSTHPHRVRLGWEGDLMQLFGNFNPRTRTGCDLYIALGPGVDAIFQSTHPHRVRHGVTWVLDRAYTISIHAPAQGATYPLIQVGYYICISIHAPAQGATRSGSSSRSRSPISIHAPAQGATCAQLPNFLHL